MPRDGAIIFADLIGKLDVLRIECVRCGHSGQYHVTKARRATWPERQAVRVVGRADGGLPAQAHPWRERPVRRAMSGFAEGAVSSTRQRARVACQQGKNP